MQSFKRYSHPVVASAMLGVSLFSGSPSLFAQTDSIPSAITSAQASEQARLKRVTVAAKRNFAEFVQHTQLVHSDSLPNDYPLDISDAQDLKEAVIAYGFPVYTIDPNDILTSGIDLSRVAKPTGEWRFVITSNGRPIGLATLELVNGLWETVAYGAATLSKDIDAMMSFHANADHSNIRFIRVFQAQSDFLEVVSASDAKARFVPLYSARESLLLNVGKHGKGTNTDSGGLLEQADFSEALRATVESNMRGFR